MIITQKFKLFLLFFLMNNFFVFSENQVQHTNQEESSLERETFEDLMILSREQTQNIGFCIQQILQTLSSNKEQITIKNKSEIIQTLVQLQNLTEQLIQNIYSKNTKDALIEGVIFTNGIMHFLIQAIKTNFKEFDTNKLIDLIHKKSSIKISDETLISLIKKNNSMIEKLIYASDRMGLTWYNLAYRKFKDLNGYSIIKNSSILIASTFFAAYLLHHSPLIKADGGFLHRWVGKKHRTDAQGRVIYDTAEEKTLSEIDNDIELLKNHPHPTKEEAKKFEELLLAKEYLEKNPTIKTYWISKETSNPETIFQGISQFIKGSDGLIQIGSLCTLSLSGIGEYLLGDWYQQSKHFGEKTLEDLDKVMSGSKANKDVNPDGQEKVYFKDMVGCEELEALARKIANFIKHPERYERAQIEEHRGILLYGPPQTGKSLFAKALRTLIQDTLGGEREMSFIDGKKYLDYGYPLDMIFKEAERLAPCILFLDEIDLIGTNREKDPKKTGQLLTCMQGIDISANE